MKTSSSEHGPGSELELKIERIVPNGFGIGFADGLTVFVPLTVPGDRIRATLTQVKKKIAFAELAEVIEPGPTRIAPPCKYFGTCGGCDLQQMDYAAQLEAKTAIVRDCLRRIAQIDWQGEIPIIGSPREFEYRSRARWHVDPENKTLGYLKRNSHEVVDIEMCLVLVPQLNAELARLRKEIGWEDVWDSNAGIDAAAGQNAVSVYSADLNEATNEITSDVGGERFVYSARAFFQGNKFMADKLVEAAIGDATGSSAIDLYSGVGLFSLPLARTFTEVAAVEESPGAVEFAKRNAAMAGLENIRFISRSAGAFLKSADPSRPPDLLVLDPPRSGTEDHAIKHMVALKPKNISYVSCEPSMLARDLKLLKEHYSITSITALDMFPQTHHVETVVRMRLR